MRYLSALLAVSIVTLVTSPAVAAPRIDVVLVTEPGFAAASSRDWYQALLGAGASNLQIRSATSSDRIQIETLPAGAGYRVTGMLNKNNELVLPGAKFTLGSRGGIGAWLTTLRDEGPARAQGAPKAPFGLSTEQWRSVPLDLATKVASSTKGQSPRDVIHVLAGKLSQPVVADPTISDQFSRAAPVRDELEGLATGTAIAAILRPEGLVLVPRRDASRNVQYVVTAARGEAEFWPVGRTSKTPQPELLPGLFETANVEIGGVAVEDVLTAVAARLETPILYDHASLARHGTDLRKKVTLPRTRTAYAIALRKLLPQAELTYELREDDAGRPLLWITSTLPD